MRCVEYNTLIAMELLSFTYSVMLSNQQALFVNQMTPAAYEISSYEQGILLPFVDCFHPHFVSCTTDEDPVHEVMRGYFDESQGLFLQNSDSISRFSCGIYV